MIDTHCHLTFPELQDPARGGTGGVLSRAVAEGVTGCITISTTTQDCLKAREIALSHPRVWYTAGVHPLYSDEGPHHWPNLRTCMEDDACVAWGELGLDNHYPDPARDVQRAVLEEQLAFIASCHKEIRPRPVVIHCREAFADLIPILRASGLEASRMVFHCFTGTPDDARMVLDFGAMLSFTGVVTYRNAPAVRDAVKLTPMDRMMVETDAPFLSPDPHRGVRPCEPWMTAVTARKLAEIKGMNWDDFHAALNRNTAAFFGIDAR